MTGVSHESLMIFHSWVGYAMFVLALIHTFPFIIFHIWKGDMVELWETSIYYWYAQPWTLFIFSEHKLTPLKDRCWRPHTTDVSHLHVGSVDSVGAHHKILSALNGAWRTDAAQERLLRVLQGNTLHSGDPLRSAILLPLQLQIDLLVSIRTLLRPRTALTTLALPGTTLLPRAPSTSPPSSTPSSAPTSPTDSPDARPSRT